MPAAAPVPGAATTAVAAAYPFHLVIDARLRLLEIGPGLARLDPGLLPGGEFAAHFRLLEPALDVAWTTLLHSRNTVVRMQHRRTGLELRGQILVGDADGPAVFLGSSWLTDPVELAEFGVPSATPEPADDKAGTRHARLQEGVAAALAAAVSVDDALARVVDVLASRLDWRCAAAWQKGRGPRLRCGARAPARVAIPPGAAELAGQALASGLPCRRDDGAGAYAVPVHSGTATLAVITGHCRESVTHPGELLRELAVVGGRVGQFAARLKDSERLHRLTSELSAIFQLSPDGFIAFNESGRRSYHNPAFGRMTGMTREDIEDIDEAGFAARMHALLDERQPTVVDLDDTEILHLVRPRPMLLRHARREARDPNGRLFGRIHYYRDITRETELASRKSEFLSTAAHELRTPMASIQGFTELMLRREFDPATRRDLLQTILQQSNRLTALVNDLLDLARIEAGATREGSIVPQALVPFVRATLKQFLFPGDHREIEADLPEQSPLVAIDHDKFIQALTNVLSNAYKYSPDGGAIQLRLQQRGDGQQRQVGVSVRDHGIGMTEAQLARVFDRFYRADPSGKIPGTGLGMALIREIMTQHGGSAELSSTPGEGTEITLWLPEHAPPAA